MGNSRLWSRGTSGYMSSELHTREMQSSEVEHEDSQLLLVSFCPRWVSKASFAHLHFLLQDYKIGWLASKIFLQQLNMTILFFSQRFWDNVSVERLIYIWQEVIVSNVILIWLMIPTFSNNVLIHLKGTDMVDWNGFQVWKIES